MKTLAIPLVIILFSGCSKKQLPHFQNTKQSDFTSKNSVPVHEIASIDNVKQIDDENQSIASVSLNELFTKENLVKENVVVNVQEKTTFQPKLQKTENLKWRQIAKIKKSKFEEKPKYEKLGNAASIFGTFALVFILITIFLALTSEYVLFFWIPTMIFANIALILGLISVKKVLKKQKARFGIVVGLIWDLLLLSFIAWLVGFR